MEEPACVYEHNLDKPIVRMDTSSNPAGIRHHRFRQPLSPPSA